MIIGHFVICTSSTAVPVCAILNLAGLREHLVLFIAGAQRGTGRYPAWFRATLSQSPFVCLFMYPPIFPSLLSPVSVPVSVCLSIYLPPPTTTFLYLLSLSSVCLSICLPPHVFRPPVPLLRLSVYLCTPSYLLSLPPVSSVCLSIYLFTPPISLPPVSVPVSICLSIYVPPIFPSLLSPVSVPVSVCLSIYLPPPTTTFLYLLSLSSVCLSICLPPHVFRPPVPLLRLCLFMYPLLSPVSPSCLPPEIHLHPPPPPLWTVCDQSPRIYHFPTSLLPLFQRPTANSNRDIEKTFNFNQIN